MRKQNYIYIIIVFTLLSCAAKKEDRVTRIFSNYINQNLNLKIKDNLHYFILIPKLGCKGCFKEALLELDTIVTKNNEKHFTIITTNTEIISNELKNRASILIDTSGKLDVLNLEISNLTLVETENKKVNFLKSISTLNGERLANFVRIK